VSSYEARTRARDPHWRPLMRGDGHLGESRDWGGFVRVRRCRQMDLPPRAPPGVRYSRRCGRDGRRGDARGGGKPYRPRQAVAAMFFRSDRLSRTLLSAGQMAAQSRLRRSNSLSHLYGGPVVEIFNYRISTTKVPFLMPSPQSAVYGIGRLIYTVIYINSRKSKSPFDPPTRNA